MVGVLWAAAILLGVAGLGKLLRPAPTSRAVIAAETPGASVLSALPVVRLLGLLEIVIAGMVLGAGGPVPAALLAISYLLLAVVAWRMISLAPGQDCGCFGTSSEPSSWSHVVVNVVNAVAAVVGVLAVVFAQPSLGDLVEQQGAQSLLLLGGSVLLAWLGYLALTALPALSRAAQRVRKAQVSTR